MFIFSIFTKKDMELIIKYADKNNKQVEFYPICSEIKVMFKNFI